MWNRVVLPSFVLSSVMMVVPMAAAQSPAGYPVPGYSGAPAAGPIVPVNAVGLPPGYGSTAGSHCQGDCGGASPYVGFPLARKTCDIASNLAAKTHARFDSMHDWLSSHGGRSHRRSPVIIDNLPTHEYLRSPRDFFMFYDNLEAERSRDLRPAIIP